MCVLTKLYISPAQIPLLLTTTHSKMKGVFEPNSIIQKGFSGRKILKKTAYTLRVTPFYTIVWYHVSYPYFGYNTTSLLFFCIYTISLFSFFFFTYIQISLFFYIYTNLSFFFTYIQYRFFCNVIKLTQKKTTKQNYKENKKVAI